MTEPLSVGEWEAIRARAEKARVDWQAAWFFAANDVPRLLAEVERLRALVDQNITKERRNA
jgi:hypothetical protein